MNTEPFDSRPDVELGAALREALDGPDPDGFIARVRMAVEAADDSSLGILARWAPAGLAAAAAAAVVLWMFLRPIADPGESPMQLIASAPARMEIAPAQPEADVLVTSLLEGR